MDVLTGNEKFTYNGDSVNQCLIDFWAWNSSDLLNNTLRGAVAEFIVASACGIDVHTTRVDWTSYDLQYEDVRIEVKSAAYIQSWAQKQESKIRFSIAPSQEWSAENWYDNNQLRHSDVYVFCLFSCKDREKADALKLEQWEFYVLPTKILDERCAKQKTIGLAQLMKLNPIKCTYLQIKSAINEVIKNW